MPSDLRYDASKMAESGVRRGRDDVHFHEDLTALELRSHRVTST